MNKGQFIKYLANRNRRAPGGRTLVYYREALEEILAGIQDQLAQGKDVSFLGFGSFYTRMRKGGKAFNIHANKPMDYKPVRQAAFRVGDILKRAVRGRVQPAPKKRKKK